MVILAIPLILGVLFASLFIANIGVINSEWNTHSDIEGFQINNATGEIKDTLYIFIDNSSVYANKIRSALVQELESSHVSTKPMFSLLETNSIKNASFLGIHITENLNTYYPWSAENKYTVFYYFSDNGNTQYYVAFKTAETLYDNPPVLLNSSDGAQLLRTGDMTIQGSFNGFFSKPRMDETTIQYITQEIMKQVNQI